WARYKGWVRRSLRSAAPGPSGGFFSPVLSRCFSPAFSAHPAISRAKLPEECFDPGGDCGQLPCCFAPHSLTLIDGSPWRRLGLFVIDPIQHRPNLGALSINIVIV